MPSRPLLSPPPPASPLDAAGKESHKGRAIGFELPLFLLLLIAVFLPFLTLEFKFLREPKSVSSKLGVKSMPTFFLIKDKEVVKKIVGANPDEVKKMVDASAKSLGSTTTAPPDIVV